MYDPHYSIRDGIPDFTVENYNILVGDSFTIIYAFMVLFTGSASDLFNRKWLLCGSCFGWCACMYLSSFAYSF
jgi:MFS family permease